MCNRCPQVKKKRRDALDAAATAQRGKAGTARVRRERAMKNDKDGYFKKMKLRAFLSMAKCLTEELHSNRGASFTVSPNGHNDENSGWGAF